MFHLSPRRQVTITVGILLSCQVVLAQRSGNGNKTPGLSNIPPPSVPSTTTQFRPLYATGSVVLQGGMSPPEPIAIERVCYGMARREGYTDFKGHFQIELTSTADQFQDVSETNSNDTGNFLPGKVAQSNQFRFEGCELRAVLAGFQSTALALHITDDFGEVKVGTIVLARMGNVEGSTISMSSMAAPDEARRAYEKGRKAVLQKKYSTAEPLLSKAVEIYPQYASAWYLLGETHRLQSQMEQAINDYNQSIRSDPQYVSPYYGLTLIAVDHKQWNEAVRLTAQLTKLNGVAYPMAYFYNSAANYNLGKLDAAEQSALKFQSLDTGHRIPDVHLLLAGILQAKHDYAGAARQLRQYLTEVPGSPKAAELQAEARRLENIHPPGQN